MRNRIAVAVWFIVAAVVLPVQAVSVDPVNTATVQVRTLASIRARVLDQIPLGSPPFAADNWFELHGIHEGSGASSQAPGGPFYEWNAGIVRPGDGPYALPDCSLEICFEFKDGRLVDIQVTREP